MNPNSYDFKEESVVYRMKDWTNNGHYNPLDQNLVNRTNQTWVGGPTHHIKDQHIPGYTGHVHGLESENLHGKPYAKLTNQSLTGDVQSGKHNLAFLGSELESYFLKVLSLSEALIQYLRLFLTSLGFIISEKDRFNTNYGENFRTPATQKQFYTGEEPPKQERAIYQTQIQLDQSSAPLNPKIVDPIDRMPVIG